MLRLLAHIDPMPDSPWGPLLAVYFTVIGLPSGITLALWWHRGRWPHSSPALDRRAGWLTLCLLAAAGVLLTIDLGRPERFFLMLTAFDNWDSPISLGAKMLAVKAFLIGVALYLLRSRQRATCAQKPQSIAASVAARIDGSTAWLLVAISAALAVYPVAVLARTWVSPLASTSGSALIYLITSLLMGCAALIVLGADGDETGQRRAAYRRITLAMLIAYGTALAFAALSIRPGPAQDALQKILTGQWALLFYTVVIAAGLLLPTVVLAVAGGKRWAQLLSAGTVLAGTGTVRYLISAA